MICEAWNKLMDIELIREIELLNQRVCKGLGDPKRVMILYALAQRPRYVSELAAELDTPQPTISRHLKVLRDCSLVTTHREANAVYYAVADDRIIQALDLMRAMLRDRIMENARLFDTPTTQSEGE